MKLTHEQKVEFAQAVADEHLFNMEFITVVEAAGEEFDEAVDQEDLEEVMDMIGQATVHVE